MPSATAAFSNTDKYGKRKSSRADYIARKSAAGLILLLMVMLLSGCQIGESQMPDVDREDIRQTGLPAPAHNDSIPPPSPVDSPPGKPPLGTALKPFEKTLVFAQLSEAAAACPETTARELAPIMRLAPSRLFLFEVSPAFPITRLQSMAQTQVSVPSRALLDSENSVALLIEHPVPVIAVRPTGSKIGMEPTSTSGIEGEEVINALTELLAPINAEMPLIIAVPLAFGQLAESKAWDAVHTMLANQGRPATIIIGTGENFSFWEEDGIKYISAGKLMHNASSLEDSLTGTFPGLLWARVDASSPPMFNIIRRAGILGMKDVLRKDQFTLSRLAATLQASPIDNLTPISTVQLRNTTSQTIDFNARWNFRQAEVRVQPQIVGFRLQPGEEYEQMFRFQYTGDRSWRSIQPTLELQADLQRANGDTYPVNLTTAPWVRIAGIIPAHADASFSFDDAPDAWDAPEYLLGQSNQVVKNPGEWQGSDDAAAFIKFVTTDKDIWAGIRVIDDLPLGSPENKEPNEFIKLYIAEENAETARTLTIWSNGTYETNNPLPPPNAPDIDFTPLEDGYLVKVRIPDKFFEEDGFGDIVKIEIMLSDVDHPQMAPKRLLFSGQLDSSGEPDLDLFARFIRETLTSEETTEEDGGADGNNN